MSGWDDKIDATSPEQQADQAEFMRECVIAKQRRPFYKGHPYHGMGGIDATAAQEHAQAIEHARGRVDYARQELAELEATLAAHLSTAHAPFRPPEDRRNRWRMGGEWYHPKGWRWAAALEEHFYRRFAIMEDRDKITSQRIHIARLAAELAGLEGGG